MVRNNHTARIRALGDQKTTVISPKYGGESFRANPETIRRLESEGQVMFRYQDNPNGSLSDIAGICNSKGNVIGLMSHPKHAVEPGFRVDLGGENRHDVDGSGIFISAIQAMLE